MDSTHTLSIEEGNRLIAEFDGWKFLPNGSIIHERFSDHGQQTEMNPAILNNYNHSWDWQVPAWSKIGKLVKEIATNGDDTAYRTYQGFLDQYENAVFHNQPKVGQKLIVKAIQWHNSHKQ